jgi:hypothetical protein
LKNHNSYRLGFLSHVRAANEAAAALGLHAAVELGDYTLGVSGNGRSFRFYAQFLHERHGSGLAYSPQAADSVVGFLGWLPYFNKRWPIATDKPAFKEYCRANGLRVPATLSSPGDDLRDFVVKLPLSSFGAGLRGPFASRQAAESAGALTPGAFCEAFVRGRIVKAFYWNERLVCVEILDMPTVTGDGVSALRKLLERKLGSRSAAGVWPLFAEIAAYSGLTLDTIPSKGRQVLADYRFSSRLMPWNPGNTNVLADIKDSPLARRLADCGRPLWLGIPEPLREGTLFSVDAIADDQDQLWFLEMNCNPVCHPDVYPAMLEWLFSSDKAVQGEGPAAPREAPGTPLPTGGNTPIWRVS